MKVEIVKVTPDIASYWLTKNKLNRRIIKRLVENITKELKAGNWVLNGEAIKFDHDGTLIDGQHRLTACVQSSIPFETYVIRDLDNASFKTLDTGAKRTAGDLLSINKIKNCNATATMARVYLLYERNGDFIHDGRYISHADIFDEVNDNLALYEKLSSMHSNLNKILTSSFFGILKHAIEIYGGDWVDECFDKIRTGENLSYGDPCLALREWSMRRSNNGRSYINAIYVKAIRAMAKGESVKMLSYKVNEDFPSLK